MPFTSDVNHTLMHHWQKQGLSGNQQVKSTLWRFQSLHSMILDFFPPHPTVIQTLLDLLP
jgi:hypothetical protein